MNASRVSKGNEFTIRVATPEDTPRIVSVLDELLGEELRAQGIDMMRRHAWLYDENPHGRAITWLAVDDASGEIAGCTSFFPRKLSVIGGRIVTGALGGDGFVKPKFRRRGIMQSLHQRSREDMSKFGIDVMYGTPMPANFTPLAVAGSKNVTEVARYVRPLSARSFHVTNRQLDKLLRLVLVPRSRAYLDPVTIRDTRVDEVWTEVRGDIGITTVRDSAYFTWRYVTSPSQRQHAFVVLEGSEPIGTCALEREGDNMRVVDIVTTNRNWGMCLRAIANYASGCVSLEIRLSREMSRRHAMPLRGYVRRDKQPRPVNVVLPPGDPGAAMFHEGSSWYFTWTETDRDYA